MASKSPVNVLLVDDRAENLLALEAVLEPLQENLVRAQSGNEALRCLLDRDFAVILIDVNMPGLDGFEIAGLIRQRKRSEHTPIIFLTAQTDALSLTTRGYSMGAVDYILTPIHPDVLQTKVRIFADLHRRTLAAHKQAKDLAKLNASALAMSAATGIESMVQAIADEARKIVGAGQSLIVIRGEHVGPKEIHAFSIAGEMRAAVGEEVEGFVRALIDQGRIDTSATVRVPACELGDTRRAGDAPIAGHLPHLEGWLSTPLVGRNDQAIGFVQVSNKDAEGAFDAGDEELLVKFARIAAVTVESALFRNAQEANRLKDEFLAILSHELRNPLNSMLGWARLLRMGELDDKTRQRALDVIERNIKSQAKLIDDLLDLSRISSGRIRLDIVPLDLDPVIEGVVDALRPVAEEKGVELALEWDSTGTRVSGDAERLGQVVWNLLTNAIKFTPSGGRVVVNVRRSRSWVEVAVRDNGEGIDPALLPHVFDHYRQGVHRKGQVGGLGLGLAIVRQMIELHAGEIRAQSEGQGKGATFILRLPSLSETSSSNPAGNLDYAISIAQRRSLDEVPRLDGIRVLVVDDDRDSREFLLAALRHQGADAVAVASSEAALEALDHLNPDVLVSDIIMPEEDGCELLKRVRSREAVRGGEVPALALTGSLRGEGERQRVLSAGFQVFMPKPIELMDLITHIAQLAQSPAGTRGEAAVE